MNALYLQTALLMAGAYMTGAVLACLLRKLFGNRSGRTDAFAKSGVATGPAAANGGMNTYQPQNISRPVVRDEPEDQPDVSLVAAAGAVAVAAAGASASVSGGQIPDPRAGETHLIEPAPLRVPMTASEGTSGEISQPERLLSQEIVSSENAARFERSLTGPAKTIDADDDKPEISATTSIAAAVAAAAVVTTAASAASAAGAASTANNFVSGDLADDIVPGQQPENEQGRSDGAVIPAGVAAAGAAALIAGQTLSDATAVPGIEEVSGSDAASGAEESHASIMVEPRSETTIEPEFAQGAAVAASTIAAAVAGTAGVAGGADGHDDLQNISRIDANVARLLNEAGVTQFAQIAAWSANEVEQVNQHLDVRGRVQKENWIEQAQVLAAGGQTIYSRGRQQIAAAVSGPTAAPVAAPAVPATPADSPVDAAIGSDTTTVAVAATAATATATAAVLGVVQRDAQGQEAQGRETHDGVHDDQTAPAPDSDSGTASVVAAAAAAAAGIAAATAGAMTRSEAPEPETGPASAPEQAPIAAITKSVDAANIVTQAPDAAIDAAQDQTATDAAGGQRVMSGTGDTGAPSAANDAGSAARDGWRSRGPRGPGGGMDRGMDRGRQSGARGPREPRSYRETRGDIGSMRSVRSEALRGQTARAGEGAAGGAARVVSTVPDDLKRVRGVGVLIERKLNSLGVTSYEQIANWTADQIADISHKLDFKGRIERENWVEQARILAAGGYTEFSSRVDRGEVDSSKGGKS